MHTLKRSSIAPRRNGDRWQHRLGLVRRSLWTLIAAGSIPMWIALGAAAYWNYRARQERLDLGLTEATHALARAVDQEFDRIVALADMARTVSPLTRGDTVAFAVDARRLADSLGQARVQLIDRYDRVLIDTAPAEGDDAAAHPAPLAIARAFAATTPIVGNLIIQPDGTQAWVPVDLPVQRDGQVRFTLRLLLPAGSFVHILKNQQLPDEWSGMIVDRQRTVVAAIGPAGRRTGDTVPDGLWQAADAAGSSVFAVDGLDLVRRPLAINLVDAGGWSLVVTAPNASRLYDLYRNGLAAGFGFVLLTGLGFTLARRSARHIAKAIRDDISDSEVEFRSLIENTADAVYRIDADLNVVYVNPADQRTRGFPPDEVIGRNLFDTFTPETRSVADHFHRARINASDDAVRTNVLTVEVEQICADGSTVWGEVKSVPHLDATGDITGYTVIVRDITYRVRAERVHADQEAFVNHVIDGLPERIGVIDDAGRLLRVNRAWREFEHAGALFALKAGDDYLATCAGLAAEGDASAARLIAGLEPVLSGLTDRVSIEFAVAGSHKTYWFILHALALPNEQPPKLLLVHEDITEHKQYELDLAQQAATDFLTGAANRREFIRAATRELARGRRYGTSCSLLMIDIDHFKTINDTYGHAAGDEFLKALAQACLRNLRAIDLFGRIGGEEFACLLPGSGTASAVVIAERLRAIVAGMKVDSARGAFGTTVSIGVATILAGEGDIDQAMAQADRALYRAKHSGRNRVVIDED